MESYDVIWVHELWALTCVPRALWARVIWDKDTLMGASYASRGGRAAAMAAWVRAYEKHALARVRHAFLSLPGDVDALKMQRVTLLPHGFDEDDAVRTSRTIRPQALRLGFVGLMHHLPNREGLSWFVSKVWPCLRRSLTVELWVAGAGLPDHVAAWLAATPGVSVFGYVDDLADFYSSIDVAIAPLLGGQGAPTKVMEALGFGVPVVGTASGLRGLPCELLAFCREAEEVGQWPRALLSAADARADLLAANWRQQYTWPSIFRRYVEAVAEVMDA